MAAGPAGLFAYGVLNRLLLVTGLHHILNNIVWFIFGSLHGATGDLNVLVDKTELATAARGAVRTAEGRWHVIVGPRASDTVQNAGFGTA